MKQIELADFLGNLGMECCVLGDGRVVKVKALTLEKAHRLAREARAAVERATAAVELRGLADEIRRRAVAAADESELARATGMRVRAGQIEAAYFEEVERLVRMLFELGAVEVSGTCPEEGAGDVLAAFTPAQVSAVFDMGLSLSDPTHAVAGLRGAVWTALTVWTARTLAEAQGSRKG